MAAKSTNQNPVFRGPVSGPNEIARRGRGLQLSRVDAGGLHSIPSGHGRVRAWREALSRTAFSVGRLKCVSASSEEPAAVLLAFYRGWSSSRSGEGKESGEFENAVGVKAFVINRAGPQI